MDVANAGFGALAFGAIGTVAIIAGFKYKWLRFKGTLLIMAFSVLLVTVNSRGIFGRAAGWVRGGLNRGGEYAVTHVSGTHTAANPPDVHVPVLTAGGAVVGLCGITWFVIKIIAAITRNGGGGGRASRDWKEMAIGAGVGVCYGTSLGFMGVIVGASVFVANNIGFFAFGG